MLKGGSGNTMRKIIRVLVFTAFLSVFIVSGYAVNRHYKEDKKQDNQYEALIEKVELADSNTPLPQNDDAAILPEYAQLFEENNELVGWIKIDGTNINYPVMQSANEPDFYLKHLFDKSYSKYGCPYIEQKCDVTAPSDNLLIYGHHMKNDKMFSQLEKFKDKSFWESHRHFSFDTLYEKQTYEIVAVFKTIVYTSDPNVFRYYEFIDAESSAEFDEYINNAKKLSLYDTGVTAVYGDKLVTLSTCEYSKQNGRFVVVAKKTA